MNFIDIKTFRQSRTAFLTTLIFAFIIFFTVNNLSGEQNLKGESARNFTELKSPVRIDFGNKDLIYVSDYTGERVLVMSVKRFNIRVRKQIRIEGRPLGVAVYNDKYIFVGNESKNAVQVFRENGRFLYKFGAIVNDPNDIAISPDKRIYVVASRENKVKVFDFSGNYIFSFGKKGGGNGEFNYPTGIAIDKENNEIVVSDFLNKRIQIFDMEGTWVKTFGGGMLFSKIDRPQGISIDSNGNYHIVDSQQACIHIFDNQGNHIGVYGEYGTKNGQVRTPLDIVFDNTGNAYVTSNLNGEIEIFKGASK